MRKEKNIRALKELDDVTLLLDSVLSAFKPKAKSELEILRMFIKDRYNVDNLKIEDLNYYIEDYKNEKFKEIGFDINEYFSVDNVYLWRVESC